MSEINLRKKAAALIEEAERIQAVADAEEREITSEEQARIEELVSESRCCSAKADTLLAMETARSDLQKPLPKTVLPDPIPRSDDNEPSSVPLMPAAPRDPVEEGKFGWSHMGQFVSAVQAAYTPDAGPTDQRLFRAAGTGMEQAVGSSGGFLVPPTFSNQIWDGLNQGTANLLNYTDNYSVDGDSLTFPANAETNRTCGNRYGGVRGYWINEADQVTSSAPKFRQVKLEPQELAALVYVTNKLLRNSPTALEQYVTRACTEELNWLIGNAIINGTGAGQPLGIMNSGALVSVAKEAGQAAATIVSENVIKMFARLHPAARASAVWLINVDCEPQLQLMTIGVGTGGLTTYLPPGGLSTAPYATLMGRPVLPIEYCQTVGTTGDIILAGMQFYAVGRQMGIESAMSIHLRFDYAESCFRFLTAIDGQSWVNSAITPANGSNTLSPFVALATRA